MKKIQNGVLYPFLIAAYPALALLAYNIEEIKAVDALRALTLALLGTAAVYIILCLALKDAHRAGLVTALTATAALIYGQVYNAVKAVPWLPDWLGRHRLLFPIWTAVFLLGIVWALRRKGDQARLTRSLNVIAVILIAFPIVQIGLFGVRTLSAEAQAPARPTARGELRLPAGQTPPDVYYIILDAYSRDDTLRDLYHLDTGPFLRQLQGLGFFVGRCSQSNYAQTQLSLTSSLNMDYLRNLSPDFQPGNTTRVLLGEKIHKNAVRTAFESLGYKTVAFETGFKATQWEDADTYLAPNGLTGELLGGITPFEQMMIQTSAGRLLMDGVIAMPKTVQDDLDNPRRIHYDLIRYNLDQLRKMPQRPGPKLVFAHLVIPHPPYAFGPNGEFINYDKPADPGYQDQVTYLDKILIPLLDGIIRDSTVSPIIIIQGDHGAIHAPPSRRLNILNAYHLPGAGAAALYDGISPVNTFRLILNQYFGGKFDLRPDVANFSVYSAPFDLTIIPNQRPGCQ
jgi:hypothetical protein